MHQDVTWYGGVGLRDIVLDGDPAPHLLKGTATNFRPMPVVVKRLDGLRCHLVWSQASAQATLCSMGTQLPRKKGRTHPTQLLAHVYCGETVGWIKMPLGTEVNLGPSDVVLDGFVSPPRAQPPVFGTRPLWLNGWMDEDTTWYGSRPRSRPHCIVPGPSSPQKGHITPPLFWPMSIVATVAHFSYC